MRRVLLDEGVPRQLAKRLSIYGVDAAPFPNEWKRLLDGPLIEKLETAGFDILLTADKSMPFQQSLMGRRVAVLVLWTPDRRTLFDAASTIATALDEIPRGTFSFLRSNGSLATSKSD